MTILRPWALEDVPTLLAARRSADLAEHVLDINDAVNARSWVRERPLDGRGRWWAIAADPTGEEVSIALGGVALYRLDPHRSCAHLAYWVLPEHRGLGHARRAAQAVSEWALRQGWYRLELEHRADNAASARVAESSGFVCEGVARERDVAGGARHDLVLCGRLASDPWPRFEPVTLQGYGA